MITVAKSLSRPPSAEVVVRRLRAYAPLGAQALALIRGLDDRQIHPPGGELDAERGRPGGARFVVAGWAARIRWLADGRRQILQFILPGDAVGVCLRPEPIALATTVAITELQTLDASPVVRALASGEAPGGLSEALRIAAAMDEALLIDQVVRLGRHTAHECICHLLLELADRLADVGLCQEGHFALPLTQEVLADATGLSIVHVNRILQQLRRERLLDLHAGRATLMDIDQLRTTADYHRALASAWADPAASA